MNAEIGSKLELERLNEAQRALEQAVADNEELMKFLASRQLEEALNEAKLKEEERVLEMEKLCEEKISVNICTHLNILGRIKTITIHILRLF